MKKIFRRIRPRWSLAVLIVLAAVPGLAQRPPQPDPEAAAGDLDARRAEARKMIADAIEKQVVREVDRAKVAADAERIVGSLPPARLDALLASRDAAALLQERSRLRRRLGAAAPEPPGGGFQNAAAKALGAAESDLLFVPLAPCRIIDTRKISAGALAGGETRHFLVAGTTGFLAQGGNGGGCGVPDGAAEPAAPAVVINFIAVGPQGPGNLRAWEFGQPVPTASVINYSNVPGLNIANGIIVPIEGTAMQPSDLSIRADVSGTHVVADVTGYFARFPIEQFSRKKDLVVVAEQPSPTDLSDGGCHRLTSCTIVAPAGINGRVIIRSWAQVGIGHTTGTHDRVTVGVKLGIDNPPNCTQINDQVANMDYEIPDIGPTDPDVDVTIFHGRDFPQSGTTTRTYALLSNMIIGASAGDRIESARMICTFIPD